MGDYNSDNGSIYSTNISLENDESNNSDNGSIYSANISLKDDESGNSRDSDSIYSADYSTNIFFENLNEDVTNDTTRSMDFGKN